jgi:hypothetical protein
VSHRGRPKHVVGGDIWPNRHPDVGARVSELLMCVAAERSRGDRRLDSPVRVTAGTVRCAGDRDHSFGSERWMGDLESLDRENVYKPQAG